MTVTDTFNNGKLVISLDFELFWGVRDKLTIDAYGEHIRGVRQAIPEMLRIFKAYDVKATFSTVGFLFAENKTELAAFLPALRPEYDDHNLSPYPGIGKTGHDENDDPYHFGHSLLQAVAINTQHEIGTHTFCHYYCLEPGQTIEAFRQDIQAARKIAEAKGISVRSLVFPRNQFNETYLAVCKECGIDSYRGNPVSWLYEARNGDKESRLRRALRFIDAYINLSGHNCYTKKYTGSFPLVNVAASRFLRPYSATLSVLDNLRLGRIKKSMLYAARNKQLFHLWWHPHNFGVNLKENILFLEKILAYYKQLQEQYGFESVTMSGVVDEL